MMLQKRLLLAFRESYVRMDCHHFWIRLGKLPCSRSQLERAEHTSRTNSAKFLKQSARITGYGNETFGRLTTDIARIQALFKRAIGPQLQDKAGLSQHDGFMAIDASNRYFTLRTEKNQEDERTITNEMDPKGYLKKAAGNAYIHTEENKVRYFEMCENIGGLR